MWAQQQEAAAYGIYVSKADLQQFLQLITLTEADALSRCSQPGLRRRTGCGMMMKMLMIIKGYSATISLLSRISNIDIEF